ncbi:hypothetical protein EVAR_53136_1 [Eumeta japonica]|uniref:Uncharacterized protein n=1 Tax=Eumeta variegata TaxID=151549 RepID=A0A4C1YAK0_EUMVA|nr:hypothetical protein EVAR_53136_1 [Eumeta japonica]
MHINTVGLPKGAIHSHEPLLLQLPTRPYITARPPHVYHNPISAPVQRGVLVAAAHGRCRARPRHVLIRWMPVETDSLRKGMRDLNDTATCGRLGRPPFRLLVATGSA